MTLVVSICAICGGAIAAPVDICYACAAADAIIAGRTREEQRSAAEPDISALPVLTVRDFSALERFARLRLRPDDPAARGLLAKLDQARVVPTSALVADVVALGTRIIFSVNDDPPETRLLVLPTQRTAAGWTLPVTAPRGLALLGRPVGATVIADRPGSTASENLLVLSVMHRARPAAALERRDHGTGGFRRVATPRLVIYRPLIRSRPEREARTKDGALPTRH